MFNFEHQYTLNSITALTFYQPQGDQLFVLAGEGVYLKVFEAETGKRVAQCRIFDAQTIHGVAIKNGSFPSDRFMIVLWGGKSFTLLDTTELDAIISSELTNTIASEFLSSDWILDGAISPYPDDTCCVFVTAHKAILKVDWASNTPQFQLKPKHLLLPSQSVIYSAHVVWTTPGSILVAAGTVFGEIEVFTSEFMHETSCNNHLFTFTGHEGSVFGVRISPEVENPYGGRTRLLASCSDDRTIRIWDLSLPDIDAPNLPEERENSNLIRETGFGENAGELSDFSLERCVGAVMAHSSRIWRIEFLTSPPSGPETPSKVHLLSFGEDSTCQQWSLDTWQGSGEPEDNSNHATKRPSACYSMPYQASLNHLHTFGFHNGKHIWSAALWPDGDIKTRLVTGGADGKISAYSIFLESTQVSGPCKMNALNRKSEGQNQSSLSNIRNLGLESLSRDLKISVIMIGEFDYPSRPFSAFLPEFRQPSIDFKVKNKAKVSKDTPNRYAFISTSDLLITTSSGRVIIVSLGQSFEWQEMSISDTLRSDLASYSLALGIPNRGVALLAGANGTIYVYHKRTLCEITRVNGKITALLDVSMIDEFLLRVLATTLGSDRAQLLSISLPSSRSPNLDQLKSARLPVGFVVTSAANIKELLILGGRNGKLVLYDSSPHNEPLDIVHIQQTESNDAITSIVIVPSHIATDKTFHFVATSRNGSYTIFSFSRIIDSDATETKTPLMIVHQAFPPLGPMIETAWFSGSDLLLYGFRSRNFVIWNETKQCEIASIECGGAHRSYAYLPREERSGAGYFVYTKASQVYLYSQTQPSHRQLKRGGHGREIKACAKHSEFIATGAEDTTIRIWRYINSGDGIESSMECCAIIEKHTAGIQHLQWAPFGNEYHGLYSSGGNEEFYVWQISKIPGFGVGVICEATLRDKSEDGDLRIMGFVVEGTNDTTPGKEWIANLPNNLSRITLIYSDSTIKTYDYSKTKGFSKISHGVYTTACLTQITALGHQNPGHFFTGATDGRLTLWSYSAQQPSLSSTSTEHSSLVNSNFEASAETLVATEIELVSSHKLHQSSVAAFAIMHLNPLLSDAGHLIATGGDDNGLVIALYHNLQLVQSISIPSGHAAGITGLGFRERIRGDNDEQKLVELLSVGVDQRVKMWLIQLDRLWQNPDMAREAGTRIRIRCQREEHDVWTSVADAAGIVLWNDERYGETHIMVYGNGIEVFRLTDEYSDEKCDEVQG